MIDSEADHGSPKAMGALHDVQVACRRGDIVEARSSLERLRSSSTPEATVLVAEAWVLATEGTTDEARRRADDLLSIVSSGADGELLLELPQLFLSLKATPASWIDLGLALDRAEFDLDPWRYAASKLQVLVAQNWRRRALAHASWAHSSGYLRTDRAVALLIETGALSAAVAFVEGLNGADPWRDWARTYVAAETTQKGAAVSIAENPVEYADWLLAYSILTPDEGSIPGLIGKARYGLAEMAAAHVLQGDSEGATSLLVAATRFDETDQSLLKELAEAARLSGQKERYHDTLMRLWAAHRDVGALLSTVRELLDNSPGTVVAEVMSIALKEARALGLDASVVLQQFREQAGRRLEACMNSGEISTGLELVNALSTLFPIREWPAAQVERLVRAAKRRMRGHKHTDSGLTIKMGAYCLKLAPEDLDVRRMMARAYLRKKRYLEARELLEGALQIDPHRAVDWLTLAMSHHEMGNHNARDLCAVRALVIVPNIPLPPPLATIRSRLMSA